MSTSSMVEGPTGTAGDSLGQVHALELWVVRQSTHSPSPDGPSLETVTEGNSGR